MGTETIQKWDVMYEDLRWYEARYRDVIWMYGKVPKGLVNEVAILMLTVNAQTEFLGKWESHVTYACYILHVYEGIGVEALAALAKKIQSQGMSGKVMPPKQELIGGDIGGVKAPE